MLVSGRVSFFLIPKILRTVFLGAQTGHQTPIPVRGEPSSLRFSLSSTGKFNSFPSFPEVLPEGTRIPRILARRWISTDQKWISTTLRFVWEKTIGGHPQQKTSQVIFCLDVFQIIIMIHPDQMGKRMVLRRF